MTEKLISELSSFDQFMTEKSISEIYFRKVLKSTVYFKTFLKLF